MSAPDQTLEGRVVLVTGAAKRIGRAIALAAAERGARVAVHFRGSEAEARRTAEETSGKLFQADLAQVEDIRRLFREVAEAFEGRLDVLVNNAAIYQPMPLLETTEEQWDALHAINLKACFFCCQQAARLMQPSGGGRIVNISSLGGLRPWAGYAPYNASKAGVIHMTRSLAKELAPEITINSVAPGVIEFGDPLEPAVARNIGATPVKRHGTGAEIAEAVMFFLTGPSYITGQILAVDGGLQQYTGAGGPPTPG